eukprot:COSAG06_NODE_6732_length_2805_cov_1.423873_2_plen_88_part_00
MDFNDSARQMAGRMSDFVPVPPIGATDLFIATPFPRPNSSLRHLFRDRIATPFLSTSVFSICFLIYLFGLISQAGVVVLFFGLVGLF